MRKKFYEALAALLTAAGFKCEHDSWYLKVDGVKFDAKEEEPKNGKSYVKFLGSSFTQTSKGEFPSILRALGLVIQELPKRKQTEDLVSLWRELGGDGKTVNRGTLRPRKVLRPGLEVGVNDEGVEVVLVSADKAVLQEAIAAMEKVLNPVHTGDEATPSPTQEAV